ncbi:hypothetical protein PpBr36_09098 [Pyricularia pennisetigena]|uniref:hypothetical protein n=1 Tax=Pyricularia pennisetigena TaxID=1578925 RepID=UPI00114E59C9|nr:hypothetical protein PpBr36_09098 [Pyricularia pennisetigena]TLS24833.1 hypothetical protein PpBr36_09098 [Pyricularia pennisetigena]
MTLQRAPLERFVRQSGPRNILLCLDAFDTLIRPRRPVAEQYAQVAEQCGLTGITPSQVQATFRNAFKQEAKKNPNYGKATNLGAARWWTNVITNTFSPFLKPGQDIPKELAPRLLHRFSSDEGYELIEPSLPETLRLLWDGQQHADWNLVVGLVSNCDDRILGIMESLGLRVGPLRYGNLAVLRPRGGGETTGQSLLSSVQRESAELLEDVASRRRTSPSRSGSDATTTTSGLDIAATPSQAPRYDLDFTLLSYDVGHEKPDPEIFVSAEEMGELILASSLGQPLQPTRMSPSSDYVNGEVPKVRVDVLDSMRANKPWLDWIKIMVGDDPKTDAAGALSRSAGVWNCCILDPEGKESSQLNTPISQHIRDIDHRGKHRLLQIMAQNQLSVDRPEGFLIRIDSVCDLIMCIGHGMKQSPDAIPQFLLQKLAGSISHRESH